MQIACKPVLSKRCSETHICISHHEASATLIITCKEYRIKLIQAPDGVPPCALFLMQVSLISTCIHFYVVGYSVNNGPVINSGLTIIRFSVGQFIEHVSRHRCDRKHGTVVAANESQ